MQRAVVLGGGGAVGVAWESGVCAGLAEQGVDLAAADLVVGTSAGAIVGTRLLAGRLLTPEPAGAHERSDDLARIDPDALRRIFELWREMQAPTPEVLARIGAIARELSRDVEDAFVARMQRLAGDQWPERPLLISAVDTASGERRLFDRASGVPIARAIAASAAVPGLFPSITIEGKRYMDGQVHSSTHLDVLLADPPEQVIVLMPTNRFTARGIGRNAERMLEAERVELEARGSRIVVCTPDEASAESLGPNLMDDSRAPAAYAAGRASADGFAERVRGE